MKEIEQLVALGNKLKASDAWKEMMFVASQQNPWFTKQFVQHAFNGIAQNMLNNESLVAWSKKYDLNKPVDKAVALLFAGNIPLVGFHDFLCCYVSGCSTKIKLSSKDDILFPFILKTLSEIDPDVNNKVELVEQLKGFDAVIATGSSNTNRYFEYYFRNYPKILRKNRNSVAIIAGQESAIELENLADDVFLYFGLGCRNVSKLFVHKSFDLRLMFPYFEKKYSWLHEHNAYMNNYDYQRTLLMLNKVQHLANNFVMLKESNSYSSPIACIHYEYWEDEIALKEQLVTDEEKIQCIVSHNPERWQGCSSVNFGQSQQPELGNFADGVDTMKFLVSL